MIVGLTPHYSRAGIGILHMPRLFSRCSLCLHLAHSRICRILPIFCRLFSIFLWTSHPPAAVEFDCITLSAPPHEMFQTSYLLKALPFPLASLETAVSSTFREFLFLSCSVCSQCCRSQHHKFAISFFLVQNGIRRISSHNDQNPCRAGLNVAFAESGIRWNTSWYRTIDRFVCLKYDLSIATP